MATEHHEPDASIRPRDRADLLRLLHGELSPGAAERLRGRLAREPKLAAALRRMEVTWELLDLPPVASAPPGFAARVAARAAEERRSGPEMAPFRPAWARAMAAVALTAGIVAGAAVGWLVIPEKPLTVPTVSSTAAPDETMGTEQAPVTQAEATGSAPAAGTTGADTNADGLDALAAGSVQSLAESYWSAFAPEGNGGESAGEELR